MARSKGQLKHAMTVRADTTIIRNRWRKALTDAFVFLPFPRSSIRGMVLLVLI